MELYPIRKLGIVWDACKAHEMDEIKEFIEEYEDRLFIGEINGGLTLVLQVADLIGNKDLKVFIKDRYYIWCTKYIHVKKLELIADSLSVNSARINIQVQLGDMIQIIEEGVKNYNIKQCSLETIRKTFRKVYQDL